MAFDQVFNLVEGILWISISFVLWGRGRRQKKNFGALLLAAPAFFVFGISDFIEIFTRAWYQPISLLLLKATCIIAFVTGFFVYRKGNKKSPTQGKAEKTEQGGRGL